MKHRCPVCGYPELREKPRTDDGGASFEICPSCGFQFGVTDDDRGYSYNAWREKWRRAGLRWSSEQKPPRHWNAAAQLKNVDR
ncbi:MAG: hypothetical protein ACJ8HQ_08135 [Chthoniobacterales bacterium]